MSGVLIGVDAGTSVVKSVAFGLDGEELAVSRRSTQVLSERPEVSEVDMRNAWSLVAETLRDVTAQVKTKVLAVGLAGTACGVWPVDRAGDPTRNALLWNDGRAAGIVNHWASTGFLERVFEVSGNTLFPGYPLASLAYLSRAEPQVLSRSRWLLFHKDYLRYQLTGVVATDPSDALYFPGDLRAGGYSDTLLTEAGLDKLRPKLPPIRPSVDVAGTVTRSASAETGLAEGTPVACGVVDVVASTLGGGMHRAGQACSILGTSFLNSLLSNTPSFAPRGTGVQTQMPGEVYLRSLVNTTGTTALDWIAELLNMDGPDRYSQLERLATASEAGAHGLVFVPYLNTAGVVSPSVMPDARGVFFGLSAKHGRAQLARAVYEGLALAMRDCLEPFPGVTRVALVGGGSRSPLWTQICADVTGKTVSLPSGREPGARGAALVAGLSVGVYSSVEMATATVANERVVTPGPQSDRYDALFELYQQVRTSLADTFALRGRLLTRLGEPSG